MNKKITFYKNVDVVLFLKTLNELIKELENPDSKYWKGLIWKDYKEYEVIKDGD